MVTILRLQTREALGYRLRLHFSFRAPRHVPRSFVCSQKRPFSDGSHPHQVEESPEPPFSSIEQSRSASTSKTTHGNAVRTRTRVSPRKTSRYTLDPRQLTQDHFVDLLDRRRLYIFFRNDGSQRKYLTLSRLLPATSCRGFLYYHLPHGAPPLAAEIRFRQTESPDPSLFPSSPDLMIQHGLPWRIPLLNLIRPDDIPCDPLWAVLVEDGLVSQDLYHLGSRLVNREKGRMSASTRLIHAFGQPFLTHFHILQPIKVIGHDQFEQFEQSRTFSIIPWPSGSKSYRSVYSHGLALCCYEKSTLPAHADKRVVVLRILRMLEPVVLHPQAHVLWSSHNPPLETLVPEEGELVQTCKFHKRVVWAVDVDNARTVEAKALSLLYDNEARATSV